MNVNTDVITVIDTIRKDFPKMMGSVMQAIGKNLVKTIKDSLKKGSVYGMQLPVLSPQRKAMLGSRSKALGGRYAQGIIYKTTSDGITVGFIFEHKALQSFVGGSTILWTKKDNQRMAKKMGSKAPFEKPGSYKQPKRPVIDLIANNPNTIKAMELSAYNRIQQKLGQMKSKKF